MKDVPEGVSFHVRKSLILFRAENGRLIATRNVCRHQGGPFVTFRTSDKCLLRCRHHGWILDPERMEYTNPTGGLKQAELVIRIQNETIFVLEEIKRQGWETGAATARKNLTPGEFTLTFYAHACAEIQAGKQRIFTDPWLVGPAFTRGWWLAHLPPSNWLDSLASANAVYISHNHSDHMNTHTLRLLLSRRPDIPIFVPDFPSRSVELPLRQMGFQTVHVLKFGEWFKLDVDTQLMILPDAAGRDDSGMLLDFKGHTLLNTVDCANLNNGHLPERTDVLLSSFASGASGFPVCWEEMYNDQKIRSIVERNRVLSLKHFIDTARAVKPTVAVPFAGYFREAHPDDRQIETLNIKNTPTQVREKMASEGLDTTVWIPRSGAILDCGFPSVAEATEVDPPRELNTYAFNKYVSEIEADAKCSNFSTLDGIKEYFTWASYRGNLVLHVIETDDSFSRIEREFMYDFNIGQLIQHRPTRDHQYSRIKVRSAVFRHVLKNGLPWEDISIGFQARFYREPDVYEMDFWDHFQNRLPSIPPFVVERSVN